MAIGGREEKKKQVNLGHYLHLMLKHSGFILFLNILLDELQITMCVRSSIGMKSRLTGFHKSWVGPVDLWYMLDEAEKASKIVRGEALD